MHAHCFLGISAFLAAAAAAQSAPQINGSGSITFTSEGNPILADGSWYSADPAPLVVDDAVYILTGQDAAPPDTNAFIMPQWAMFVSPNPDPAGSEWTLYPNIATPSALFAWAAEGTAYAAQVVQGRDQRFYMYTSVTEAASSNADPFAIGVAVADTPLGPYTDAHPSGPIVSQSVPAPGNDIQNIDPTVFADDDGSVYLYFGTFGRLLGYQLDTDMTTVVSDVIEVDTSRLTGYFEAPWLMKRRDIYYMIYAANNAGEDSPCTPTSYHACIAYGSAPSPLGPWSFQGIVLPIVSSTTSHPGVFNINDTWYLVYHTADAQGGYHFRRSVAFDELTWDDSQSPPTIRTVQQTFAPKPAAPPTSNIAGRAIANSANTTPIQYWVEALHDGVIRANPLPPDIWCSYNAGNSPRESILSYTWNTTVRLNGTAMVFFADHEAGASEGVAPPAAWHVEYLEDQSWEPVANKSEYSLEVTDRPVEVQFDEIETTSVRAVLYASGRDGTYAGLGVKEWLAFAASVQ
ncbi:glycosyl hydrolase [Aspergillus aurantiobrunneus]